MASNVYTAKFMAKVPRTPLARHIESLHEMAYWSGIYGSALEMFEHHLMSIAVYTSVPDPIREGIRREVEQEFRERGYAPPPPETGATTPERYETFVSPPYDSDQIARDIAKMGARVTDVMRQASERLSKWTEPKTPEQAEARAQRRYEQKIAEERRKAKDHLNRESYRVRGELRDNIHIHVPAKTGA